MHGEGSWQGAAREQAGTRERWRRHGGRAGAVCRQGRLARHVGHPLLGLHTALLVSSAPGSSWMLGAVQEGGRGVQRRQRELRRAWRPAGHPDRDDDVGTLLQLVEVRARVSVARSPPAHHARSCSMRARCAGAAAAKAAPVHIAGRRSVASPPSTLSAPPRPPGTRGPRRPTAGRRAGCATPPPTVQVCCELPHGTIITLCASPPLRRPRRPQVLSAKYAPPARRPHCRCQWRNGAQQRSSSS